MSLRSLLAFRHSAEMARFFQNIRYSSLVIIYRVASALWRAPSDGTPTPLSCDLWPAQGWWRKLLLSSLSVLLFVGW
jgi:hypothetical protein